MQIIIRADRHMVTKGQMSVRASWYTTTAAGYSDGEIGIWVVPFDGTGITAALRAACEAVLAATEPQVTA